MNKKSTKTSETLRVPLNLDEREVFKKVRVPGDSDYAPILRNLIERCRKVAAPKAFYRIAYCDPAQDAVLVEGQRLSGTVIQPLIGETYRVFPYVATCGNELEEIEADSADPMSAYCLDEIRKIALNQASAALKRYVTEKFGLERLSSINPGSGPAELWPIDQQKKLFAILGDVESAIGVRLTSSCLMVPTKSLSGILFAASQPFEACQLCPRTNCPGRRAEFKSASHAD
jgi:hypothetical protein